MYTVLFAGQKLIGIVQQYVYVMIMTPEKKAEPVTEGKPKERYTLELMTEISKERGVACNSVLTLRLPGELKDKLRQVPNWQDEVRKALAVIAGY